VANKPVLFYGLEAIADVGITDAGLVIGDTAPAIPAIEEAVGDGSAFGIRASYIRQEAPGLAHAVLIARDFLGDDDFVMYLGDNFIVVIRLEEKPRQPRSDLVLVGVYMFTSAIHDAVRDLKPSWRGELEITEAIQWLIDHGKTVHSSVITGFWKDIGNVADMLEVNRLVLEGLDPRHDGTTARRHDRNRMRDHRQGRDRSRRARVRFPHRGAGRHRRRGEGHRLLHRPVQRDRRGLRDRGHRDRVLDRAPRGVDPRGPAYRSVPHRPPRPGHARAPGASGSPAGAR
jgi:dTDP-glucose pyrophosphorylase